MVLAEVGVDHVVADEQHQRLERVLERPPRERILPAAQREPAEGEQDEPRSDEQREVVVREVERDRAELQVGLVRVGMREEVLVDPLHQLRGPLRRLGGVLRRGRVGGGWRLAGVLRHPAREGGHDAGERDGERAHRTGHFCASRLRNFRTPSTQVETK